MSTPTPTPTQTETPTPTPTTSFTSCLYAWGNNLSGQLGNNSVISVNAPEFIYHDFVKVSSGPGLEHALGIKSNGSLYAWGRNTYGQLGTGNTDDYLYPIYIGDNYTDISVGGYISFGIKNNGKLYAWGDNSGRLGFTKPGVSNIKTPTLVGLGFVKVVTSGGHSLALKSDGKLYSWGDNTFGQLGDGTLIGKITPTEIGSDYKDIGIGYEHSIALKTNGDLYVWGRNNHGQIGDNSTTDTSNPKKIGSGYLKICKFAGAHTLAIDNSNQLFAWGYGEGGQIGDGNNTLDVLIPTPIGSNYIEVEGGMHHTLALKTNGDLYAWGDNNFGQIGYGGPPGIVLNPTKIGENYLFIRGSWQSSYGCKSCSLLGVTPTPAPTQTPSSTPPGFTFPPTPTPSPTPSSTPPGFTFPPTPTPSPTPSSTPPGFTFPPTPTPTLTPPGFTFPPTPTPTLTQPANSLCCPGGGGGGGEVHYHWNGNSNRPMYGLKYNGGTYPGPYPPLGDPLGWWGYNYSYLMADDNYCGYGDHWVIEWAEKSLDGKLKVFLSHRILDPCVYPGTTWTNNWFFLDGLVPDAFDFKIRQGMYMNLPCSNGCDSYGTPVYEYYGIPKNNFSNIYQYGGIHWEFLKYIASSKDAMEENGWSKGWDGPQGPHQSFFPSNKFRIYKGSLSKDDILEAIEGKLDSGNHGQVFSDLTYIASQIDIADAQNNDLINNLIILGAQRAQVVINNMAKPEPGAEVDPCCEKSDFDYHSGECNNGDTSGWYPGEDCVCQYHDSNPNAIGDGPFESESMCNNYCGTGWSCGDDGTCQQLGQGSLTREECRQSCSCPEGTKRCETGLKDYCVPINVDCPDCGPGTFPCYTIDPPQCLPADAPCLGWHCNPVKNECQLGISAPGLTYKSQSECNTACADNNPDCIFQCVSTYVGSPQEIVYSWNTVSNASCNNCLCDPGEQCSCTPEGLPALCPPSNCNIDTTGSYCYGWCACY